jgi:PadR family transcriptional regulator, regulatory protein PadR
MMLPMRRKPGVLLPIEVDILDAALALRRAGTPHVHGFQLARAIVDRAEASTALTAHGTLYKALARMEGAGLLTSAWEAPDIAAADGRPRRRLYEVTGAGERALAAHQARHATARARPAAGPEPA